MIKLKISKQNRFGYLNLKFGIYLGFVISDLEFEIDQLRKEWTMSSIEKNVKINGNEHLFF